jgi:hypothetical protein
MVMAAVRGYFFLAEPLNLRIVSGTILISIALFGVSGYGKVLREKFKNKISVE